MLWLPLLYWAGYVGYKFVYDFMYINVYLDIGGLGGDSLLAMSAPLLAYALFLGWALPRLRGIEDGDALRNLAFRMVTVFAVITSGAGLIEWLLRIGAGASVSGAVTGLVVVFVAAWFAGVAYMALISTLLGLRWVAMEAVARMGRSGISRAY
ncbi:MAG: hypothetical protein R3F22_09685 [Lysobacteraceae bacterium]